MSKCRRTEWDDAWDDDHGAFCGKARTILSRMEREYERDGDVAIERLARNDPLGYLIVAVFLASEED